MILIIKIKAVSTSYTVSGKITNFSEVFSEYQW